MNKCTISRNYLCFDALLEMIVTDICPNTQYTQFSFAELFGITIPNGEHTEIKNVRFSSNIEECGTNINVNDINAFFDKNQIPLSLSFVPANHFDEATFDDYLVANSRNSYVVFAFCYGVLYNEPQNANVGHVSLLKGFGNTVETIEIYDPGPRNSGVKIVKTDDMFYAMRRRGGIYSFKKTNLLST